MCTDAAEEINILSEMDEVSHQIISGNIHQSYLQSDILWYGFHHQTSPSKPCRYYKSLLTAKNKKF